MSLIFNSLIQKIKPAHIFLLCFSFYAFINFFKAPPFILIDDEAFYFFQAKSMFQGHLVLFERTNPYLFPFVLSVFSDLPLPLLRLVSVFFMSLGMSAYFCLLQKNINKTVAFFASLLLAFHPSIVNYAVQLYTESLLLLLLFLIFGKLFDILSGKNSWVDFSLLGIYMGLSLETKPLLPIVPLFFLSWILLRTGKALIKKTLIAGFLSILFYLPYYFLNGISYLQEKFRLTSNLGEVAGRLAAAIDHFGVFFSVILFVSVLVFARKKFIQNKSILNIFISFCFVYVFFIVFVIVLSFPRYFLLCLPVATLLIAQFVFYEKLHSGVGSRFIFAYFALFLFVLSGGIRQVPIMDRNVHFRSEYPAKHVELRDVQQSYLFKNVSSSQGRILDLTRPIDVKSESKGVSAKLPIFDQESNTIAKYEFNFYISENSYRFIFFSHLCDRARIVLDGKELTDGWEGNPFVPYQVNLIQPLKKGFHTMVMYILNDVNIGGIGQVFLFEKDISRMLGLTAAIKND